MVHSCILCKTRSNKTENISFHRFPKNEDKKREWLRLLNIDFVSDSTRICSLHFKTTDYAHILEGGKQYLKRSAVPSVLNSQKGVKFIIESSVHNEQKTTFETVYIVTKEEEKSDTKVKTEKEYSEINSDNKQDVIAVSNCELTSSRLLRSKIKTDNEGQLPLKNVRRLGDINIDNVSKSPEESKLCLEVATDIINELKAKIKSLQIERNKLKEKVIDLKFVKKRSKDEELISDKTFDNLHAKTLGKLENQYKDSSEYMQETNHEVTSSPPRWSFNDRDCGNNEEPPLKSARLNNMNIDEVAKSSEESKLYLEIAMTTVKELRIKIKYLQTERNKLKKKMQIQKQCNT